MEHLVEDETQGVDVRGRRHGSAGQPVWCCVLEGSPRRASFEGEVHQAQAGCGQVLDDDVARFDVTVQDTGVVHGGESVRQDSAYLDHHRNWGLARGHEGGEEPTLDPLHGQEGGGIRPAFKHPDHHGVTDPRQGSEGLFLDGREQLECRFATVLIDGQPDSPHASLAEALLKSPSSDL